MANKCNLSVVKGHPQTKCLYKLFKWERPLWGLRGSYSMCWACLKNAAPSWMFSEEWHSHKDMGEWRPIVASQVTTHVLGCWAWGPLLSTSD